jgi:pyrroloquinoline quinone (PQQ) biosynthesis protein C
MGIARATPESLIGGRTMHPIVQWLESETASLLSEIQSQEFWSSVMSPDTDPQFVKAVMREVYSEIIGYQPHVIEAAIAAIAQMPRSMNPRLIKSMLSHQAEEFDHGEMALRDLVSLGVPADAVRHRQMSPEAFAVAGVWWMIVQARVPFAYLGALFLFEGLTPVVTQMIKPRLVSKGMGAESLNYLEFHSTEDVKHANLVHYLINETASEYPESVEAVRLGFRCFRAVYPVPLWRAAFERAQCSFGAS